MNQVTQLLTVHEVAEVLRQTEWSVRQKIVRGEIPAVRIGLGSRAPLRVDADELEAWIYSSPPKPPAGEATSLASRPSRAAGRLETT